MNQVVPREYGVWELPSKGRPGNYTERIAAVLPGGAPKHETHMHAYTAI